MADAELKQDARKWAVSPPILALAEACRGPSLLLSTRELFLCNRVDDSPTRAPSPHVHTATMESYSPNLIRMWRVWRTTKEMCAERVLLPRAH